VDLTHFTVQLIVNAATGVCDGRLILSPFWCCCSDNSYSLCFQLLFNVKGKAKTYYIWNANMVIRCLL